jgi:hypothetical protein
MSTIHHRSPPQHYPDQFPNNTYNLDSPLASPEIKDHPTSPNSPFRALPTSPRLGHFEDTSHAIATASSSSLTQNSPRERISPTTLTGFLDQAPSPDRPLHAHSTVPLYGQSSPTEWTPSPTPSEYSPHPHTQPLYSPAPGEDVKREHSVKPPLHLNAYTYDDTSNPFAPRNRAPYEASPTPTTNPVNPLLGNYPLSGGAYARKGREKELGEVRLEGVKARWNGFYDSAGYWLGLYFFFNLGLTLFNKVVLVSFPFPYVSNLCSE